MHGRAHLFALCGIAAGCGLMCLGAVLTALPAAAQDTALFPASGKVGAMEAWTRVAIPPDHPLSKATQWYVDFAKKQVVCYGNGGHEWLRFNSEFTNFAFHVKWRFTPVPDSADPRSNTISSPKYNSGVFFRNNLDGSIWHQAQTTLQGGYIFGVTPVDGKATRFNLQKEMRADRVKPAGQWNTYDIKCEGDTCTLAVNGKVVNTAKVGLAKGYIGLEAEGYRITFKDLRLHELK